jgi:hypothetical protein
VLFRTEIFNRSFNHDTTMPVTGCIIRNFSELESSRKWWEQWQHHPNSDYEHYNLVCRLRAEVVSPLAMLFHRNGEPCTLIAGRLERIHYQRSVGYWSTPRIPATVMTFLHQGALGAMDEEIGDSILSQVWKMLSAGEADAAVFHHLAEDCPLLNSLLCKSARWWSDKNLSWNPHWSMILPEEPDFLLKRMRSKHRAWVRRKERDLAMAFPKGISWRWLTHFNDIGELCGRIEKVATLTYQRGLQAGFVDDEEYRQRFVLFAKRNQLRVQLLEIANEIRAFWIGIIYNGVFHSWATGYDPVLRAYEPGTLIFHKMIGSLVEEKVKKLDFGLGDAHYKQRFGDQSWREATLSIFSPTPKGMLLRTVLGCSRTIDSFARSVVAKVGIMDRLKTGWRKRLEQ